MAEAGRVCPAELIELLDAEQTPFRQGAQNEGVVEVLSIVQYRRLDSGSRLP
jgi:hypothetical protein